jgi:hypothetical protein
MKAPGLPKKGFQAQRLDVSRDFFSSFMKSAREKAGLTVEMAAILAGIEQEQWLEVEAGEHFDPDLMKLMMPVIGITDADLAGIR